MSPETSPPKPGGPVIYNFEIYGTQNRILGAVALASDLEAVEFGKNLIRDLMAREGDRYSGCTLLITEAARTVAAIPIIAAT